MMQILVLLTLLAFYFSVIPASTLPDVLIPVRSFGEFPALDDTAPPLDVTATLVIGEANPAASEADSSACEISGAVGVCTSDHARREGR